jgi:ubiquinone/menaquinone biosynthesis C-methylase UbiE
MKKQQITQEELLRKEFSHPKEYAHLYEDSSATAYFFNKRIEKVDEFIHDWKGGRLLDVGCGPGMMVSHMLNRGFSCFGIDISEEMIKECGAKFHGISTVDLIRGTIEKLPFSDATFDVVLAMGIMEYVNDVHSAASEMARVLKPNGILIASMLNKFSPYRLWEHFIYEGATKFKDRLKNRQKTGKPVLKLFTEKAYKRLLSLNRFKISDVVYFDFNLFVPPFEKMFPRHCVDLNKKLEFLCTSNLRWLGTGFIIKARKLVNKEQQTFGSRHLLGARVQVGLPISKV